MGRKTRYERIVGPKPKPASKEPKERKPSRSYEEQARDRCVWPFELEEKRVIPADDEEIEEIVPEGTKHKTRVVVHRHSPSMVLHQTLRIAIENGLQQAYISGYCRVVRDLEDLPFIIQQFSRSKRLQKEVKAFIRKLKDKLASGERHV